MLPAIPAADPRTIDLIVVRRVAWISDKVRGLIIYSIYEGESG